MIRLASVQDAPLLRLMRLKSLETDPDSFVSTPEYESNFSTEYFARKITYITQQPDFGYWIHHQDQTAHGYCQLVRETLPKCDNQVYLYELYIYPEFRHHHFAKEMLVQLIKKCQVNPQITLIKLKVNQANLGAVNLYTSLGFTQYGQLDNAIKSADGYQSEMLFALEVG